MNKLLVSSIIGFIAGTVLGLCFLSLFNITVKTDATYGILEAVYYIVGPIGVLATMSAVIVALFGEDIKRLLNKEKCKVSLEYENFSEDISGQEGSASIESNRYDCNIILKNTGNREIEDCSVYLISAKYRDNQQSKWRNLKIKNKIQLYWSVPYKKKETLLAGESKSLLLLRINPDGDQSTPDEFLPRASTRRLTIIGFSPDIKYRQKGYWETEYSICTPHRELQKFKVCAYWSGEWKQREKEMVEETSLKLEIL